MPPPTVSIVTPSYCADLHRCELLCESIDLFVTGYENHLIVVGDEDLELFRHLNSPKRMVVPSSQYLPSLLPFAKWRGRRYWWSPRIRIPVYGWHLQQLRKIAVAAAQDSDRVVFTDSDCVFCKPSDLRELVGQPRTRLFLTPGDVNMSRPDHIRWWRNAYRCLGYEAPDLPGDDFIGPLVVWDKETVSAVTNKIEQVSGQPWWLCLARQRQFSEYMTYGIAVINDPELMARHDVVTSNLCLTYWEGDHLDRAGLASILNELQPHHCAVTIQSHTETSVDLIRETILAEVVKA
ncbi:DUF6492 family protein [Roseibium sp. SCP14]|uniref:DUF6492 family protein n=1 Tax=Roseibium sp. SCP14 TaxID=3141375 RepID=UPI003337F74D